MTKSKAPKSTRDYEVGYCKPPKSGQFRKGQPRPPRKPKPPEAFDFGSLILDELNEHVHFKDEEGNELLAPKARYLAKMVVNQALKTGNLKQLSAYLPRVTDTVAEDFSDADLALIGRALSKLGLTSGQNNDP